MTSFINDILDFPNTTFYINNYFDPFLFYNLTGSFAASTLFTFIWEAIEYLLYNLIGHYPPLIRKQESYFEVIFFDIGGAFLAVTVAYLFNRIRKNYYGDGIVILINSCCKSNTKLDEDIENLQLLEESTDDSFDEALKELTELTEKKNCWERISISWRRQILLTVKIIVTLFLSITNCDYVPESFETLNLTFLIEHNWIMILLWLLVNSLYVYFQFYPEYAINKTHVIFMYVILLLTFTTTFVCRTNITWPPAVVCFIMYCILIILLSIWGILMYYIPKSRKFFCNNYTEDQIKAFKL